MLISTVFSAFIGVLAFFPALMELPERLRSLLRERLALFVVYVCVVVIPSLIGLFFVEFRVPKGRLPNRHEAGEKEGT